MNFISNYRKTTIFILFLILILIKTSSNVAKVKDPAKVMWNDRAILFVIIPLQNLILESYKVSKNLIVNYVDLVNVNQEKMILQKQMQQQQSKIDALSEVALENQRLRQLLDFKRRVDLPMIPAEVVAENITGEYDLIRINKGRSSGLKPNLAVVTNKGLVGRTYKIYDNYSDVATIFDPRSSVDALIQRDRTRGMIEGNLTRTTLDFRYVERQVEANLGDRVLTSGKGGVYPKGIFIGSISYIEKLSYGIVQTIKIVPFIDFDHLEEVLVILNYGESTDLNSETEPLYNLENPIPYGI